ncbi:MAG: hypothetical protein R2739_02365 [Chitinophagales bacterium]|nr:hypothetical protein [Bacteroidota bacterium]
MLTPLKYMAHVLLIFLTFTIVQAQNQPSNSILCYVSADYASHTVKAAISPSSSYKISCNYENTEASIPKFIQFKCAGNSGSIEVKIHISNGKTEQTFAQTIQLNQQNALYEMPVLVYVSDALSQSKNAHISAIEFNNLSNSTIALNELNFSNFTSTYEVKLNQVFTVDKNSIEQKNYIIKSDKTKYISLKIYSINGGFASKVNKQLQPGNNILSFNDLNLKSGKYVVTTTENNQKDDLMSGNISALN